MVAFLYITAALFSSVFGRYDNSRLLSAYFWDDDLWDTVTRDNQLTRKCISDRNGEQLCLCHSKHKELHPFLCDDDRQSGAHENFLNLNELAVFDNDDQYDYYFPASNAQNNDFLAPGALANVGEIKNIWRSQYGPLDILQPPLHRAHVIPKHLLIQFYEAIYRNFEVPEFKKILEPLFDAIAAKLV